MKQWICVVVFGLSFVLRAGPGGGCGQSCAAVAVDGAAMELKMPVADWLRLWTDELAARDLYAQLDAQTQRRVFQNIGRTGRTG
jgi:hypothetical protein